MLNYIWVFIISMLPIIELRGAIPFGIYGLWPISEALPIIPVIVISIIGNILPVPFLIIFGGKVLRYFAKFEKFGLPFRKILDLGEKKVSKMKSTAKKALFWGLFAFVAIPLPGTGAWTGALIAITLGLDMKKAFLPIACGVMCAGAIIVTLFYFAPNLFQALVG